MKKVIIITSIVVLCFKLNAQNAFDNVLIEVEKNNTSLSAFRKSIDAEKIGNKTGLAPQNPGLEFNYLWGNPSTAGNRTDFSIKQSFDFPTAYSYKSQIADLKNEHAELDYKKQQYEILHQTRVVCIKLIHQNALKAELKNQCVNAVNIADACKKRYDNGNTGILEYNKAQVNLLNLNKELEYIEIERNALLSELILLNGGKAISFNDSVFSTQAIPSDFGEWYTPAESGNPQLQLLKQEIAISEKQTQLTTTMNLPKLYAGYMSEKVAGQQFQGLSAGITIPLWENKNTGQYAKARTVAMQNIESDAKLKFYNEMKAAHSKATALQNCVSDYRSKLAAFSNTELLNKALGKGEISLTEYLYELSLQTESIKKLLEIEMNLNMALIELTRYR